ncbi:MAG: hypothetical protein EXR53_02345 [Dehalococcoidia bacterium]|nr:hypothetical protein [Dehalococcoidia bacterium]
MSLPLSGIHVVEMCKVFAGPFSAMMLADQGAEVICESGALSSFRKACFTEVAQRFDARCLCVWRLDTGEGRFPPRCDCVRGW